MELAVKRVSETGYGEAGSSGPMARGRIQTMKPLLVGKDPLLIEVHFHQMTTLMHTYLAHIPTITGIDMALWDLAGKLLGQPVSALLGGPFRDAIPMYRREFPSIDTPILQYFSERKVTNLDDRKQRITIRHLLTMTSGFAWREDLPYNHPDNSCSLMEASADWVQYAIDQPMADRPGDRFNYNSGATILLAHIFQRATGQDIEEYAAKNLFVPLGIIHYYWKRTPWGLADTEGGLYLERHDLARIVYLFHKDGVWERTQIVSPNG